MTLVKFLADENFKAAIVRGLLRRRIDLDIEVRLDAAIGQVIEDVLLLAEFEDECQAQIRYVPL